jgi:protein MpaA
LIDEREAVHGIIRPTGDFLQREKWPESIYLRAHHTTLAYTIESPSAFPLVQRVAAHRAALETALKLTCGSP